MREIKFRAWDLIDKRMKYYDMTEGIKLDRIFYKFHKLMQFTGLKDNGNEGNDIYEDDLVNGYIPDSERDQRLELGIIKFKEGGFAIYDLKGEYLGSLSSCTLNKSITVAGNIYENPELSK